MGRAHLVRATIQQKRNWTGSSEKRKWTVRSKGTKHTITVSFLGRIHFNNHFGKGGKEDLAMCELGGQEPCSCFHLRDWVAHEMRNVVATGMPHATTKAKLAKAGIADESIDEVLDLFGALARVRDDMVARRYTKRHHLVKLRNALQPKYPVITSEEKYKQLLRRSVSVEEQRYRKDAADLTSILPSLANVVQDKSKWPRPVLTRFEMMQFALKRNLLDWRVTIEAPAFVQVPFFQSRGAGYHVTIGREPYGIEALNYGFVLFDGGLLYSYEWETEAGEGKVARLRSFKSNAVGFIHAVEYIVEAHLGRRPLVLVQNPVPTLPGTDFYAWDSTSGRSIKTQQEAEELFQRRMF